MRLTRFPSVTVALLALACAGPLYAQSYYPLRPDDPRAVYLTKENFGVQGDGVADDANGIQQAIDRAGRGIVFIPEGRYRLGKTIYVGEGIRLIGYGAKRPVFVLGKNTPGFQEVNNKYPNHEGTGKYMVHFTGGRGRGGGPIVDASEVTFYSAMSNIDFEMQDGNPGAIGIRFHVAQH